MIVSLAISVPPFFVALRHTPGRAKPTVDRPRLGACDCVLKYDNLPDVQLIWGVRHASGSRPCDRAVRGAHPASGRTRSATGCAIPVTGMSIPMTSSIGPQTAGRTGRNSDSTAEACAHFAPRMPTTSGPSQGTTSGTAERRSGGRPTVVCPVKRNGLPTVERAARDQGGACGKCHGKGWLLVGGDATTSLKE